MADRGRHAKKIQSTHWTYSSFASGAQTAGTFGATLYSAQHLPETLLRLRGEWLAYMDGTSGPGDLVAIGIGFIQVPEGSGATVTWSPITDGDAPWIWVDYALLGYEEMVTDVVDVPGITSVRRVIDNKAMRILRNTEIQCVVENATVQGASAVNVALNVRSLTGS